VSAHGGVGVPSAASWRRWRRVRPQRVCARRRPGAAIVGAVVFIVYLFIDPDRAWRAFHFNWWFFRVHFVSRATVAAVQRITTARWSREVVRIIEGYVAFLPVAFVFLVLIFTVGRSHIFPWTHIAPPVAEKRLYLAPGFLISRDLIMFAILTLLALWFVYLSVRLDVGSSRSRRGVGARHSARMRAGFGDERRELHTTHSRQGVIAVFMVLTYGISSGRCCRSISR